MTNSLPRPQVSVIVPVWNAELYIAATLRSIRDQEFAAIEVLVVDDCSTDRSADIIKDFVRADHRFKYYKSPSNFGGPAGPRNIGLDAAQGELIAFCDADDIWVSYKLSMQVETLRTTQAHLICSAVYDFHDENSLPTYPRPTNPAIREVSHLKLSIKNWIALSSVVVEKSVMDEIGHFNTHRSFIAVEDYDMWLRLSRQGGRIYRISSPLVHYRKLPTSISANKMMMIQKALYVIGIDYAARGKRNLFRILKPMHWSLYVISSAWMRAVRREL